MNERKAEAMKRAGFVRDNHKQNGGAYTTQELAKLLSVSDSSVLAYLHNEICPDESYVPPHRPKTMTAATIRKLLQCGFSKGDVAAFYGVSKRLVDMRLEAERKSQLCQAS